MATTTSPASIDAATEAPRARPVQVIAIALGVMLLVSVLRAWLPSLITIYGAAGSTPAEEIGLFALAWFAAALPAVPLARWVGADRLAPVAALVAALALVATGTSTAGGNGQLYLLSTALLAALVWLVCAAMTVHSGRWAAIGLTAGLGVAVALHAALGTLDLIWRTGLLATLGQAALACAFVGCAVAAMRLSASPAVADGAADGPGRAGARAMIWLLAGPALLLTGIVTGATARADAAAAQGPAGWASAAVVLAAVLATALAARPQLTGHPAVAAVLLVLGVAGATLVQLRIGGLAGVSPSWTVGCQALGALALGATLGWVGAGADARAAASGAADRPTRRGLAAAFGALILLVLTFCYYAAYEIDFGFPNTALPVAAAVGIGAAAITIGRRSLHWSPPAAPRYLMTAITVAAVVAAGSVVAAHNAPAGARAPREFPVRMVSYNIRMGFSLDGRFDPDALAATINRERPDVVLLSEVDRGWFLNGGHDDLQLLADRLGMRALFAPAADPVWGDALLTRLPIVSIRSHPLPRAGAPIGATAIAAVVSVGGQELGVVGVHLQAPSGELPTVQATAVADIAQDLARGGRPVVVAGDMNITPQSREFASLLASGLRDGFADVRPFRTFPADHPTEEIDHVFTTPNLGVTDATVPDGTGSDHRAVAVTLSLRDPA